MIKYIKMFIGVSAMSLSAANCSHPQREFMAVQVCLADEDEAAEFTKIMREVARSERLTFLDGSTETEKYLEDVRDKGLVKLDHVPTINVSIEGQDGLGVTAGNLGLPSNQMALGFTLGRDPAKARGLANHLVRVLSQRYHVQTVPHGQGSFPLSLCDDKRSS